MAQLTQDEWPEDDEPTTSEQEGDLFKREGHPTPAKNAGRTRSETNRAADESVIDTVPPDRQVD